MIKAILFDMDGVLVDSEDIMMEAAITYFKKFGATPVPEDFVPFFGAGEKAYLGGVAEKYGIPYNESVVSSVYTIYGEIVERSNIAYPGVTDILKEAKANGYKLALCTSARMMKVTHNLRALGITEDFFDAFVTGENIKNNKPAPDIFLVAAEKLDICPSDCCVIEDSINGIQGAKAGKMKCIAITTTFPKEELTAEGPDMIIDDIRSLPEALKRI